MVLDYSVSIIWEFIRNGYFWVLFGIIELEIFYVGLAVGVLLSFLVDAKITVLGYF